MKAHQPDDREPAPRRRPSTPAPLPEASGLLRLNHLAGNAAVTSLLVQRISLTEGDKQRIKTLDKKLAATAKKRIKAFTTGDGGLWNFLTGFPIGSKVPGPEREAYLVELYRALGRGESLDTLTDLRTRLDVKHGETLVPPEKPEKPGKQEESSPKGGGFAPSLDQLKATREKLVKHVEEKKKPPAVWATFPEPVRQQLMGMWAEWQAGKTDAKSFYDDVYKRSAVKAGMDVPSAGEYIEALDAQGVRGGTSDAQVKDSGTGYPLQLDNKGGKPRSRIYLNPHPRHIADVYRFVKDRVHPLPGVIWVKLADHARAMTVRDVIVVYLTAEHAGTEQAVAGLLAGYQKTHLDHFVKEVPHLTRTLLPGVGVGDEPPNDALTVMLNEHLAKMTIEEREPLGSEEAGFSFSMYRSKLIVRAIEDAGGDVGTFQSLVVDYFVRAGIDPADPARQGKPDPSAVPLLGMVWRQDPS